MASRELKSASEASFALASVETSPDNAWNVVTNTTSGQPCTILDPDQIIRVAPMNRQYGGWNDAHFHPQLRLPLECNTAHGMVVTCQAMARECVAIALSPDSSFVLGKTLVIHFGAAGNVSTVIRRRLETKTEAVDVTLASRVCSERSWISYWIALLPNGKLHVGTGNVVGKQCIGYLDDSLYTQLRPNTDAVKFVGLGNSALGKGARPLKIRHVCVTTVPPYLSEMLSSLSQDLPLVTVEQEEDEETTRLMEEYQKECQKNRARAAKFNIPYKEPSPQAFLQWSQARKLRANPEKGFITGMDIYTDAERAKQEARKARFGMVDDETKKRKGLDEQDDDYKEQEREDDTMMDEDIEPLPIKEAWDNEELVRKHREDPPVSLFVNPPPCEEKREETEEFAMDTSVKEAALVPEKIHLFGIDWAAFKQIRTGDIMTYFSSYGPSYVEWLGELSCNVLFEDKFSAARALQQMSQELPSPPPPEVGFMMDPGQSTNAENNEGVVPPPDLGNMGWRFCQRPIRKAKNDRYGRRGTTARLLMRLANTRDVLSERPKTWPKPPPGFTTKRVLGPGSDFDTEPQKKKRRRMDRDEYQQQEVWDPSSGAEHPALSRGLASGREGFSLEELQRERTQKAGEGES